MDGGKDWLEAILKRKAYDETPIKVLEIHGTGSGPGAGKGDNYLSLIHRIKAKVLLGSGRIKDMSFLVKCEHESEHMKKMSLKEGMFRKEITMYQEVLPMMQELMEEVGDPEGVFWPQCYDVRLYNRLIFGDLTDSGYRVGDRSKQLSLNAALMALKHLAKFHALSRILMDRGQIPTGVFGEKPWIVNPEAREEMMMSIVINVKKITAKMETWGDEWKEATGRLRAAKIHEKFIDSFKMRPDEFTVVCHGDSWTNNMMFGGEDIENPTSFRLIDLQLCMLNSPAKDVGQFILTSVRIEDKKQHYDLLVNTYADALKSYLTKFGYEGDIPSVEDIRKMLDRNAAVELVEAIMFVPIILADVEHPHDFEGTLKKFHEAKEKGDEEAANDAWNLHEHLSLIAKNVIEYQVRKAMETGLI